jgi:hypothetical protein
MHEGLSGGQGDLIIFVGRSQKTEDRRRYSMFYPNNCESHVKKNCFAGDEDHSGDIHFIASPSDFSMPSGPSEKINACCKNYPVDYLALLNTIELMSANNSLDLSDAELLTDDKPALVSLYNYSNEEWRLNTMNSLLRNRYPPPVTFFH